LESLKGKYVYIDVWATCVALLQKYHSCKKVEDQYQGKTLSLSAFQLTTLKIRKKWSNKQKQMGGI
jgi:hypothetical protein